MPLATRDIHKIYLAYFGRPADPTGMAHWQSQSDLLEVANAFAQSPEYQSLYAASDSAQLVTNIYQNLFKRAPEAEGLKYWVQQLDGGKLLPGEAALTILQSAQGKDAAALNAKLDAAQAFLSALNTPMLVAAYKGAGPATEVRTLWAGITDAASASAAQGQFSTLINQMQSHWVDGVQKVYVAYFGRPADSTGLNYWVDQAIANQGDWQTIAQGFAASPESQKLYGNKTNAELIDAIYLNVLGRTPEPTGKQYWLGQLDGGKVTPAAMALTIASNTLGKDTTTLNQRIDAANAFTQQLDVAGRTGDFFGATVTNVAREWLYGIGPDQDDYSAALAAIPNLVGAFVKGQVQGTVVNGYIAGATVFIDSNNNGQLDAGEVSVKSDAAGNFLFPENAPQGTVVATGGTVISTGQPNTTTLKAPVGATVVTPLTNLVQQLIEGGQTLEQAENLLFGALGVPKVDLSAFDPLKTALNGSAAEKALAIQVEAATVQVANTLATGSALLQGAGLTAQQAQDAMLNALTQALAGGAAVDLTQPGTLQSVLQQAVENSPLTPAQQTQAHNAIAATSQVLGEINDRTAQAADAFSNGTITNPVSAISDLFKLATLTQTEVIAAVQQATSSGSTTNLTTNYTGDGLTQSVDDVKPGSIDPDTPTDDGTDVTNGGGTPPPPPPPPSPTFTVTENNGVYTFGGTATGNITVSIDAQTNVVTFTRGGIAATTTIDLDEWEPGTNYLQLAGQTLVLSPAQADAFSPGGLRALQAQLLETPEVASSPAPISGAAVRGTGTVQIDSNTITTNTNLLGLSPDLTLMFSGDTSVSVDQPRTLVIHPQHAHNLTITGTGFTWIPPSASDAKPVTLNVQTTDQNFVGGTGSNDDISVTGTTYNNIDAGKGGDEITLGTTPAPDWIGINTGIAAAAPVSVAAKNPAAFLAQGAFVIKQASDLELNGTTKPELEGITMGERTAATQSVNLATLQTGAIINVHGVVIGTDTITLGGVADADALAPLITSITLSNSTTGYGDIFLNKHFLTAAIQFSNGATVNLVDVIAVDAFKAAYDAATGSTLTFAGDGSLSATISFSGHSVPTAVDMFGSVLAYSADPVANPTIAGTGDYIMKGAVVAAKVGTDYELQVTSWRTVVDFGLLMPEPGNTLEVTVDGTLYTSTFEQGATEWSQFLDSNNARLAGATFDGGPLILVKDAPFTITSATKEIGPAQGMPSDSYWSAGGGTWDVITNFGVFDVLTFGGYGVGIDRPFLVDVQGNDLATKLESLATSIGTQSISTPYTHFGGFGGFGAFEHEGSTFLFVNVDGAAAISEADVFVEIVGTDVFTGMPT